MPPVHSTQTTWSYFYSLSAWLCFSRYCSYHLDVSYNFLPAQSRNAVKSAVYLIHQEKRCECTTTRAHLVLSQVYFFPIWCKHLLYSIYNVKKQAQVSSRSCSDQTNTKPCMHSQVFKLSIRRHFGENSVTFNAMWAFKAAGEAEKRIMWGNKYSRPEVTCTVSDESSIKLPLPLLRSCPEGPRSDPGWLTRTCTDRAAGEAQPICFISSSCTREQVPLLSN